MTPAPMAIRPRLPNSGPRLRVPVRPLPVCQRSVCPFARSRAPGLWRSGPGNPLGGKGQMGNGVPGSGLRRRKSETGGRPWVPSEGYGSHP